MPLPLIPIIAGAASLATGVLGLKKGYDAKKIFEKAREIGEKAQRSHQRKLDALDKKRKLVNTNMEALGQFKLAAFEPSMKYVVEQVRNARSSIEGFNEEITSIDTAEVAQFEKDLETVAALNLCRGTAEGVLAGSMGAFGAYGAVGMFASASTGTAISTLSGAAASKATLAWLGGGSLATGGLGVAGGAWVLGGLVAGPALAITGYTLASKAEEALTQAEEYKASVDKAIAEIDELIEYLNAIQANIDDTHYALKGAIKRFEEFKVKFEKHKNDSLHSLKAMLFGTKYLAKRLEHHDKMLQTLIGLGKMIKSIAGEPLLDRAGAAVKGFQVLITGHAAVAHLEETNPCIQCSTPIHVLARVCPACNTAQDAAPNVEKTSAARRTTSVAMAGLAVVLIGLAALGSYWYLSRTGAEQPAPMPAPLHAPLPAASTEPDTQVPQPELPTQLTAPPSGSETNLIDWVVQHDTLGMTLEYFESRVGPARYASTHSRSYVIDGCQVTAALNPNPTPHIQAIQVQIDPNCNARLGNLAPAEASHVLLNTLTINTLERSLNHSPLLLIDCLVGCGNAYDPGLYAVWSGSRADNFIDINVIINLAQAQTTERANVLAREMLAHESEEWVLLNGFNCQPQKYRQFAHQLFSDITPAAFTFGRELYRPICQH